MISQLQQSLTNSTNLPTNLPSNFTPNLPTNLPSNLPRNLPTNFSPNLPTNFSNNNQNGGHKCQFIKNGDIFKCSCGQKIVKKNGTYCFDETGT